MCRISLSELKPHEFWNMVQNIAFPEEATLGNSYL